MEEHIERFAALTVEVSTSRASGCIELTGDKKCMAKFQPAEFPSCIRETLGEQFPMKSLLEHYARHDNKDCMQIIIDRLALGFWRLYVRPMPAHADCHWLAEPPSHQAVLTEAASFAQLLRTGIAG